MKAVEQGSVLSLQLQASCLNSQIQDCLLSSSLQDTTGDKKLIEWLILVNCDRGKFK